jgi:hypothetical protein
MITQTLEIVQKSPEYINYAKGQEFISQARNAIALNNQSEAKVLAEQGKKEITTVYKQFINALKALKSVKNEILQAKESGADISISIKIFQQAKNALKNNDFNNALVFSNLCKKQLLQ